MSEAVLDALAQKLHTGDAEAADLLFRQYEPFLRIVVRRKLSPGLRQMFDSVDVVQSVWADVIGHLPNDRWRFADSGHLRAFLVKAARNRLVDRVRQHKKVVDRQRPLDASPAELVEPVAGPSQQVQADDLWQQLLMICPPQHRQILLLKRDGCSLDDIARQTGLHKSSVRRILYDLARQLAARQTSG